MRVGCCGAHLVIDCRHDGSPSPPMVSAADRKHDTTLTTYLLLLLAAQLNNIGKTDWTRSTINSIKEILLSY